MRLKKYIPKHIRNIIHFFYAWWGSVWYRHPSEELFVIGVTGTSGKSSTVYFLRHLFESLGYTVGSLSTIDFYIAGKQTLNNKKMTMLGKMAIQKYLRQMVGAGCTIAIVETTSEGAVQFRHRYINYDLMMLTNLYPEHIESHGSFENYKAAKKEIFRSTVAGNRKETPKIIGPRSNGVIQKTAVVNGTVEYAKEFLEYQFDKKYVFGIAASHALSTNERMDVDDQLYADAVTSDAHGITFTIDGHVFRAPIFGEYNASNIAGCVAVLRSMGVSWDKIIQSVATLHGVPGRIEFISEADAYGFRVIVDYAFEPVAMAALYQVVDLLRPRRIIHVFGSTGGGRDVARRATVGAFVGEHAHVCIVTDEDPYDDDPTSIIADVARAVEGAGKVVGKDLYLVADRRQAIEKAIAMAEDGDIVLVTGKGSEQAMVVNGVLVPWDDRSVVRDAIRQRS